VDTGLIARLPFERGADLTAQNNDGGPHYIWRQPHHHVPGFHHSDIQKLLSNMAQMSMPIIKKDFFLVLQGELAGTIHVLVLILVPTTKWIEFHFEVT
jgi:hypothetical protein